MSLVLKADSFSDADVKQWAKYLEIEHPFKCMALDKTKEKTKQLIRRFIPHQLRSKAWPLFIHDRLAFTRAFYSELAANAVVPESVKVQISRDIERSFPDNG